MNPHGFKHIEYSGFSDQPTLKAYAERASRLLFDEISLWRDRVEVSWEAHPTEDPAKAVELTLELTLPDASGRAIGYLPTAIADDDAEIRSRCRRVWGRVLDSILDQQLHRIKEWACESAEV